MYGIFTYICPNNHPNVGKYTLHGAYGSKKPPFKKPPLKVRASASLGTLPLCLDLCDLLVPAPWRATGRNMAAEPKATPADCSWKVYGGYIYIYTLYKESPNSDIRKT